MPILLNDNAFAIMSFFYSKFTMAEKNILIYLLGHFE